MISICLPSLLRTVTLRALVSVTFALLLSGCKDDPARLDPARLEIAADSAQLIVGDSLRVAASLVDVEGRVIPNPLITWTSSDSTIAAVTEWGRITGRHAGRAVITAISATARDSIRIHVMRADDCSRSGGQAHSGTIESATWRASDSPHVLSGSVVVKGTLTLEPRVLVCGAPSASLIVEGELVAQGTSDGIIRFIAQDTTQQWNGINVDWDPTRGFSGLARLRFAHVAFAESINGFEIEIEDSWIRHSDVGACNLTLRRTTVDSANVSLPGGVLEDNVIRSGSVRLARVANFCGGEVWLNGGRIEESPGIALEYANNIDTRNPLVQSTKPVRIVGSEGYPVSVTSAMFMAVWPTRAAQDSLVGNVNDTLVIQSTSNSTSTDPPSTVPHLYVRRDLPVKLRPPQFFGNMFPADTLTLEAGASLLLDGVNLVVSGKALARGTSDMPIHITNPRYPETGGLGARDFGIRLRGSGESEFSHVVFGKAYLTTTEQHAAKLSEIRSNHWIDLAAPGSELSNVEIHDVAGNGVYTPTTAALRLAAPGIVATRVSVRRSTGTVEFSPVPLFAVDIVASDVTLTSCEISDNGNVGVRVNGTNVRINDCNIERNGGVGVNNVGTARLDARRNWWGDPAGPEGPNGDGVSGDIDYSEHRAAPMPPIVFRVR